MHAVEKDQDTNTNAPLMQAKHKSQRQKTKSKCSRELSHAAKHNTQEQEEETFTEHIVVAQKPQKEGPQQHTHSTSKGSYRRSDLVDEIFEPLQVALDVYNSRLAVEKDLSL